MAVPLPPAVSVGHSIALLLAATVLFSVMTVLVKWLGAIYGPLMVIFGRCFFALIPVLPLMMRHGLWNAMRTGRPGTHAFRCAIGIVGMALNFYALTVLPLADVVAIGFTVPMFSSALSIPLLGEKVRIRRWSAVVVGFLGVLLVIRPGFGGQAATTLVPLAAALCNALALIWIRKLTATERSETIMFYFMFSSSVVAALALPLAWRAPGALDLLLLVIIGLLGGIAQIMHTTAFRGAPVAMLAPFEYSAMLWAVIAGYLVWGDIPTWWTGAGTALIVASGLYILHREIVVGRQRRAGNA
jgi:drug/metabolite transporter (DMT)-like permease